MADACGEAPRPEWGGLETIARKVLNRTAKTRGLPELGTSSWMTGDSLSDWFDVLLHTREVTATRPY